MKVNYPLLAAEKERDALRFIVDYIAREDYPPKLREIGDAMRPPWSKSKCSDVHRRLAAKGYLQLGSEARAIKVLQGVELLDHEIRILERNVEAPA